MNVEAEDAAKGATDFVGNYFYFHTIEGLKGTTVSDQKTALGAKGVEREKHTIVLKEIIGNPFRPVPLNPAWLTPTVLCLAEATYDNRNLPSGTLDNARLAVLADALEDGGCNQPDILNHLRQPGVHVRGCWVVDLLLGKE